MEENHQNLTYLDDLSTATFSDEIQEEANSYFQQVFIFYE